MNKDLKKLAKILRSLDVYAKIEEKGTENEFLCVREKNGSSNYEWQIWYDDAYYELHLFVNNELVYDQTYLYTTLFVVGQLISDIQKY
jgi:hypothetical protein